MAIGADDAYERFNKEAKAWGRALARSVRTVLPTDTGELKSSTKSRAYTNRTSLAVEAVRLSFAKQGIFVELGVGKGRPSGSAAAASAKTNNIARTVDARIAQLERIVEQWYGPGTENTISANLPDSINFKIT